MGGILNFGGLATGLDTNAIISALVQIERQPIQRIQRRIQTLNTQKTAITDLRNQLLTLRNRAQDFRLTNQFDQFTAASSEESVLGVDITGQNPLEGAFNINVTQLASATVASSSASLGSPINTGAALDASGIAATIEAGVFTINGVSFNVDPTTDTLDGILGAINSSAAGVTATYDALTDRVTFENSTSGDTSIINFSATGDTSNLLTVFSVTQATQTGDGAGGATRVTGTTNLGAVSPSETLNNVSFANGAVTAGSFRVNGISITVDPAVDSLSDILSRISGSDAGVSATYDANTDTIRVSSRTLGSPTISFQDGTSNFLSVTNLTTATQTAGNNSQFAVNGGPVQTRNSNSISDAISGVTLNLLSVGASTATVSVDNEAVVEDISELVTEFNNSITQIRDLVAPTGAARNDGSLRIIESFLRSSIFEAVPGVSQLFTSLLDVGISTGDSFDASAAFQIELDEEAFLAALEDDRTGASQLFTNEAETGILDKIFLYLDEATSSSGFLNERVRANGLIDDQIESQNNRIDQLERRVATFEARLRRQFIQLEQLTAGFQQQGASLAGIGAGF